MQRKVNFCSLTFENNDTLITYNNAWFWILHLFGDEFSIIILYLSVHFNY